MKAAHLHRRARRQADHRPGPRQRRIPRREVPLRGGRRPGDRGDRARRRDFLNPGRAADRIPQGACRPRPEGSSTVPGETDVEDGASVLEHDCDILVPAALELVINLGNAERIPRTAGSSRPPMARSPPALMIFSAPTGHGDHPRPLRQRRRRYGQLFRMGEEFSHIRFGRMQRRQEEAQHALLVGELDRPAEEDGALRRSVGPVQGPSMCMAPASWSWFAPVSTTRCAPPTRRCGRCGTDARMSRTSRRRLPRVDRSRGCELPLQGPVDAGTLPVLRRRKGLRAGQRARNLVLRPRGYSRTRARGANGPTVGRQGRISGWVLHNLKLFTGAPC